MIRSLARILASMGLVWLAQYSHHDFCCADPFLCTNRSDKPRRQQIVQLYLTQEEGQSLGGPGTFSLRSRNEWTCLGQADDLDEDGTVDELIFLSDFEPGETKRVMIGMRTSRASPQAQAFPRTEKDQGFFTLLETNDLVYTICSQGRPRVFFKSHPALGPRELFRPGVYRLEKRKNPIVWIPDPHAPSSEWQRRCVASGPIRSVIRLNGFCRSRKREAIPVQIFYVAYPQKPWVECRIRVKESEFNPVQICAAFKREERERFYKGSREGTAVLQEIPFPWCRALILPPLWNRGIVQPAKKRRDHISLLDLDPAGRVVFRAMAHLGEGDSASQWDRWCSILEEEADSFCHSIAVERLSE